MLLSMYASFVVGGSGGDVLTDAGLKRDYVYAKEGNDVVVYTPSLNHGKFDEYDGGAGIDTLWLRMSKTEFNESVFQSDMIRLYYFIMKNGKISSDSQSAPLFHFRAFNLQVRNIENVIVERIKFRQASPNMPLPTGTIPVLDSSVDTLV